VLFRSGSVGSCRSTSHYNCMMTPGLARWSISWLITDSSHLSTVNGYKPINPKSQARKEPKKCDYGRHQRSFEYNMRIWRLDNSVNSKQFEELQFGQQNKKICDRWCHHTNKYSRTDTMQYSLTQKGTQQSTWFPAEQAWQVIGRRRLLVRRIYPFSWPRYASCTRLSCDG
jgi:hypothetical protein